MNYTLATPLTTEQLKRLRAGDRVKISGTLYTARDTSHKRLIVALAKGKELPIPIKNQIIYYNGPSPSRPGRVIGSAGPTTSLRMDPYTVSLLKRGLKGMIGKGVRSPAIVGALKKYKAVYFVAPGGCGALLAQYIRKAKVVAYPDLGPEAIYQLEIKDFPVIVANDISGRNLFKRRK
jgi:fumarate hydratase subunit beta